MSTDLKKLFLSGKAWKVLLIYAFEKHCLNFSMKILSGLSKPVYKAGQDTKYRKKQNQ
jgi:hypothetical protein